MKILVIGGFGYIGSALIAHLQNIGLDCVANGNRQNDYNNLSKDFLNKFDRIVLLAGHSSVPMCLGPIESPWLNNVVNFKNLLEKVNYNIPIIYASSSSIYSNSADYQSTETDISLECVNNYDLTKTVLDLYAYQQIAKGRCIIGCRFGTVNGPSPVLRTELMINAMVYSALTKSQITITNKHVHRPILGINDLVAALETVLTTPIDILSSVSGQYNMSSFNTTVEKISNKLGDMLGVPIIDKGNTDKVYNFSISTAKFENTFNFKFTNTADSIVNTLLTSYRDPTIKLVTRSEYFNYIQKND